MARGPWPSPLPRPVVGVSPDGHMWRWRQLGNGAPGQIWSSGPIWVRWSLPLMVVVPAWCALRPSCAGDAKGGAFPSLCQWAWCSWMGVVLWSEVGNLDAGAVASGGGLSGRLLQASWRR